MANLKLISLTGLSLLVWYRPAGHPPGAAFYADNIFTIFRSTNKALAHFFSNGELKSADSVVDLYLLMLLLQLYESLLVLGHL
jgi:hypothetical protein